VSISKRFSVVVTGSALLVVAGAGLATADPSGTPTYRPLAGVGSDTTQDVMNGLAKDIKDGSGNLLLGSYDATGTATIQTKATGCTGIPRPNGSGAGRTALLNSLNANSGAGDGCLQFARSSSLNTAASSPSLTYVPFATDAVSYAVTTASGISRQLNLADLTAMYHCDPTYVGSSTVPASNASNTFDVTPMLPQAGSGTRSFWEGKVGISDADVNNGVYPCILNGAKGGQTYEEHTGTLVDDKSVAPFSIAQYDAQATSVIADRRGRTVLGSIGSGTAGGALASLTYPVTLNGGFNVRRDVYNVIPTAQIGTAPYSSVFVGTGSAICQDTATILKFGFAPSAACGDTTNHS
jgi:hypothetical protein